MNRQKAGKQKPRWLIITLSVILAAIIAAIVFMAVYIGDYYHADPEVGDFLPTNVTVSTLEAHGITDADGIFYDGPGTTHALIFYPGAKVEYTAYAPLMARIAAEGIDCFLIQMPLNIAFTNSEAAAYVMNSGEFADAYDGWIIGGHSLGGVVASSWVYDNINDESIYGVLFLASYPTHDMTRADDLYLLSIYGSKDGVLNRERFEENNDNYLNSSHRKIAVINGGNHAQFGNYGPQKKDGEATITREDQQEQTAELITTFMEAKVAE